jgi:hypothetical protein
LEARSMRKGCMATGRKQAERPAVSEKEFQRQVIALARFCGWRCAHFRTARVQRGDGSVYHATPVQADGSGWPDLCLVHARRRLILHVELKTDKGPLSPDQKVWLRAIADAGGIAEVWRPSGWGRIEAILKGEVVPCSNFNP